MLSHNFDQLTLKKIKAKNLFVIKFSKSNELALVFFSIDYIWCSQLMFKKINNNLHYVFSEKKLTSFNNIIQNVSIIKKETNK